MDAETIKFITDQNHELKEDLKEYIQAAMTLNRAKIINELDPIKKDQNTIVEQNKIRNGRIEKLECETRLFRWMHRHPGKAVVATLVLVATMSLSASRIHIAATIKNITGIEMKEDESTK